MDSSKNIGATEECSSNESGWTMYIASPIHETNPDDDDDDDDDGDEVDKSDTQRKGYKDFHDDDGGDGESDDSMASDASSGPSHQGGPCGTSEGSHGRDDFEHAGGGGGKDNRRSSGKKQYKQVEKKGGIEKTKAEKEEQGHKVKSSTTGNVYNKGKTRKNK